MPANLISQMLSRSLCKIILGLAIAFGFTLSGCQTDSEKVLPPLSDGNLIVGLATPIQLKPGKTVINLQDWVLEYDKIDSINVPDGLQIGVKGNIAEIGGNLEETAGNLTIWAEGQKNDVLLKKSNKKGITLRYDGKGKQVRAKGEFNAWNAQSTLLEKGENGFATQLLLNPGSYQYLLVADGKEMLDPSNNDSIDNGIGGYNSLIKLPRPSKAVLPMVSTTQVGENWIEVSSSNQFDDILVYWQNSFLGAEYLEIKDNQVKISIPEEAAEMDRSFIRIWAYNQEGLSNDVLIPLSGQNGVENADQLTRYDKESNILYFLMVDRFNNGNETNDEPVDDPSIHPKANYFGGDLAGVTAKIKDGYFDQLGINTIWLSPITQNPKGAYGKYPEPETTFSAYHGYWPISSSKVDYRFGTSEELEELVCLAHENDMNVILDYVANHVHEEHPIYQNNKGWATNLYLPDGSLNTERWDDHRLTTWFDVFLPTLDLSRPEVVDPMTDSALFWLERYNLDGFRHDATKHIPEIFWRELTRKTKERIIIPEDKSVLQIGETYGSRELISSYISSGMLEAQFDFNLYDDAVAAFARDEVPFFRLVNSLKESLAYYGDHNLMGNITGNQDRARFISYADGSIRFDEDSKYAGWTRKIEIKDTLGYRKLNALIAFMMTVPGIPVIYYGDEIGMPGGNDPDNRRMMRFDEVNPYEQQSRDITTKLIQLRRSQLPLIYGDTEIVEETSNTIVLKRSYFGDHVLVIFNKSKEEQSFTFDKSEIQILPEVHFGSKLTKNDSYAIHIKPFSFEILTY